LPGGVTPPIATLPPQGVTPGLPGGIAPPIATLPPQGVMPTLPGGVTPPIAALPPAPPVDGLRTTPGVGPAVVEPGAHVNCLDPARLGTASDAAALCPREVPITSGRQILAQSAWNSWMETNYTTISDHRYGMDLESSATILNLGIDRMLSDDLVLGVSAYYEQSWSRAFGGTLRSDSSAFLLGPYVAIRLSRHWAIDGSLTLGETYTDQQLDILNGKYASPQYMGAVNLRAQYDLGWAYVRPLLSLTYQHTASEAYAMGGFVLGRAISVVRPQSGFDLGAVELSAEMNRTFQMSEGNFLMPYLELGTHVEFDRPNGGALLTGSLATATPSPWSGWVRSGLRMSLGDSALVEARGGYLSVGQGGLNTWEALLRVSIAF
jgi:hypothetical protein